MSEKDDERFWNLMIYKVWATDKEMEEMGPFLMIALVVMVAILIIIFGCSKVVEQVNPTSQAIEQTNQIQLERE